MCSTYIVIQIIPINETFCGGAVTYSITVSPSHDQIYVISETRSYITGLTNNTLYEITINALRGDSIIHQTTINQSTRQPLSKYAYILYSMYILKQH